MVKKRLRTSRKENDSDEIDSESDYGDDPPYDPAPKKYSLRQRKRTTFTDADFQYDDEELPPELSAELPAPKPRSEDEDFEVEKELELDEAPENEFTAPSTYVNTIGPENCEPPEDTDELVDFEDMIRADIVVNKNRIDYDNVIQKTEIKVQPLSESEREVISKKKIKTKRTRKPKRRNSDMDEGHFLAPLIQEEGDEDYHPYKPKRERRQKKRADGEIDSSFLEPETEVQEEEYEDKDDEDYNPEEEDYNPDDFEYTEIPFIDPTLDETKITDSFALKCQNENALGIPVSTAPEMSKISPKNEPKNVDCVSTESLTKIHNSSPNTTQPNSGESGSKEASNSDKISTEESIITTNYESNTHDTSPISNDFPESSIYLNGKVMQLQNPEVHFVHKLEEEEADDEDVVLIDDLKHDVIVLDD